MWKLGLNVTANVIYSTYAHVSHNNSPPWSIKRVCTWPVESKMNSLTERKGFPVTLFQWAGAWIRNNIYILVSGRMGLLCSCEEAGESQAEWNSLLSKRKGSQLYFKVFISMPERHHRYLSKLWNGWIEFPIAYTAEYRHCSVDIILGVTLNTQGVDRDPKGCHTYHKKLFISPLSHWYISTVPLKIQFRCISDH